LDFVLFYVNALTARCILERRIRILMRTTIMLNTRLTRLVYITEFSITRFWHGGYNKTDYQKLGWYLGFREPSYTLTSDEEYIDSVSAVTYKCYLTGESTYGNNVDNYFFVSVEDYNNNFSSNLIISENENSYGSSILARIPIMVSSTEILTVNFTDNQTNKREYFGPVSIER
jgi:hypothetical protein